MSGLRFARGIRSCAYGRILSKQGIEVYIAEGRRDRIGYTNVAGFHRVEKLSNFTPDVFFFAADARNRQKSPAAGIFRRQIFGDVDQWADEPDIALPGLRNRRQ